MSQPKPFKTILVGCGSISQAWLNPTVTHPLVEYVGLVDLNIERAEALKAEYGLTKAQVSANLAELLTQVEADLLFDCAVPEVHAEITHLALQHGCHVLGEKPLAMTMAEAGGMVEAARAAGKTFAVMQNRRFLDGVIRLREAIRSGLIGELTTLNADFYIGAHFGGFRDEMEHVLLLDMAIHSFDQARFIGACDPLSVYCHEWNPAGSWYRVDVADTGTGIAPDILPRVLEPFFTTKPVGKGSGLGLPQVYGIMRQHGGDLLIKSRLNVGTTISLFLPDKQASAAELPEHVQHQLFVTGHGEHIVVIDDDRHVLAATADMLRHLGYYPILFTDGREALDSLKQGTVKADLLLADARMPHLSGEQLLPELEAINFASPIVIMTGFVPEIQTVVRENSCVVACVQKPFNVELLANTIASALAR